MEKPQSKPAIGERTKAQRVYIFGGGLLGVHSAQPAAWSTYRRMRKHPTIALARAMIVAPIVAADWSVERDDEAPEDAEAMVADYLLDMREQIIETTMNNGIDFGFAPWEKVFRLEENRVVLHKLKPLLPDMTEIQIDKATGAFIGYKQGDVLLPVENCLNIPFRVEGTDWYGEPLLENARQQWNEWLRANEGAARYDERVAGSHWLIYYPAGEGFTQDGELKDNDELAQAVLAGLRASGNVAIPREPSQGPDGSPPDWEVQLLGDNGSRQPGFIERLRYLDVQIARAMLLPERTILEGQHGTLAESEAHADLAMTNAELSHEYITRHINWHVVDQLLALNYGEEYRGTVRLVASPIVDASKQFLRDLYKQFLSDPNGFLEESSMIDTSALKESLGVPIRDEAEQGRAGGLALPGMDPNDPTAATVRRLYAEGIQEEPVQESKATSKTLETTEESVLNGSQIKSASEIVIAVANGVIPRDAGLGQLEVLFNLTKEQAARIMGSAGQGFTPRAPEGAADASSR